MNKVALKLTCCFETKRKRSFKFDLRSGLGEFPSMPRAGSGRGLPTLLSAPAEGETCRRRGSMNGVKEEEDLCFCIVLLLDWLCTRWEYSQNARVVLH